MNKDLDDLLSQILEIQTKTDEIFSKINKENSTRNDVLKDLEKIQIASNELKKKNIKLVVVFY